MYLIISLQIHVGGCLRKLIWKPCNKGFFLFVCLFFCFFIPSVASALGVVGLSSHSMFIFPFPFLGKERLWLNVEFLVYHDLFNILKETRQSLWLVFLVNWRDCLLPSSCLLVANFLSAGPLGGLPACLSGKGEEIASLASLATLVKWRTCAIIWKSPWNKYLSSIDA